MIGYIAAAVIGFGVAVCLYNWDDWKRSWKTKRIQRRYQKLLHGTPKRTVHLLELYDLFHYRNYPLYIDGRVYSIKNYMYLHVNDRDIFIVNSDGERLGYIDHHILGSRQFPDASREYQWGLCLKKKSNGLGIPINVSAVVEVY